MPWDTDPSDSGISRPALCLFRAQAAVRSSRGIPTTAAASSGPGRHAPAVRQAAGPADESALHRLNFKRAWPALDDATRARQYLEQRGREDLGPRVHSGGRGPSGSGSLSRCGLGGTERSPSAAAESRQPWAVSRVASFSRRGWQARVPPSRQRFTVVEVTPRVHATTGGVRRQDSRAACIAGSGCFQLRRLLIGATSLESGFTISGTPPRLSSSRPVSTRRSYRSASGIRPSRSRSTPTRTSSPRCRRPQRQDRRPARDGYAALRPGMAVKWLSDDCKASERREGGGDRRLSPPYVWARGPTRTRTWDRPIMSRML